MAKKASLETIQADLRTHALAFPESHEDFPWGERALKVKGKVFVFMRCDDGTLGLSVKLPFTGDDALAEPFAKPTGYGLGKSGWVSLTFEKVRKSRSSRSSAGSARATARSRRRSWSSSWTARVRRCPRKRRRG